MAMPRYKYAIGNAPVRFPSSASQDQQAAKQSGERESTSDLRRASLATEQVHADEPATLRSNRWSLFSLTGTLAAAEEADGRSGVRKARSQQNLRKANDQSDRQVGKKAELQQQEGAVDRARSVSLYGGDGQKAKSPQLGIQSQTKRVLKSGHAQAEAKRQGSTSIYKGVPHTDSEFARRQKRVSWVIPSPDDQASRASSRASSIRSGKGGSAPAATEQTSLLGNQGAKGEMTQQKTSFMSNFKPSSLFWTDMAVSSSASSSNDGHSTPASKYGATSATVGTPTDDDPYGYRAMAGPALLPVYHEQRESQKAALASATPTRRYARIALFSFMVVVSIGLAAVLIF